MNTETWRPVVGFEGWYEVSDLGRVRSVDRVVTMAGRWAGALTRRAGRVRKPRLQSNGYLFVNLSREGNLTIQNVHQMVARAFLGPRPPAHDVCHGNGDKTDNRLENLRYDTRSANNHDRVRHGTHPNASQTHCIHGHEFTPANTILRRQGGRDCRACLSERSKRYRRNKKQKVS